jgi:putative two-component system response regulator
MMRYWKSCAFAAVAALLVTPCTEWQVNRRRLTEFRRRCQRLGASLEAMPGESRALGAVTTLGSTQDGIRRLAAGSLPAHDPGMERLLLRFSGTIGAENAFVLDRAGIVVGNALEPNPPLPPRHLGLRPYFQAAIHGHSNSYAALGGRSGERGLYVAAPVAHGADGVPVGVVVAKMGFQEVDALLQGETGRFALVSPEGVVFSANVPDWLFRVEGGQAQAALARRAPRTAPAFAGREPRVLARDSRFRSSVEQVIDWQDPGGAWKLVGLADPDSLFGPLDRVLLSAMVFLTAFLAGAVWLERRRRILEASRHREDLAAVLVEGKRLAEQSAKAKADFLANMSHEIRTPLNAIIGMAHLGLKADPNRTLGRILATAEHLLAMLNGVLDASKLEAGKVELERVDFPLATVLGKVEDLLAHQAAAKGLVLAFASDPRIPAWLTGDPGRLGQVLINLADNAVKFTERGGVQVRVDLVEDTGEGVLLHFSVRDTGLGLSGPERERLFRSFHQGDPSIARKHGGTGLGLAICKDLVALMGGELGVESEPGQGSTFWFELRLGKGASPGGAAVQQAGAGRQPVPAPVRILLAEDDGTNREIAVELLREAGFGVEVAENGAEAVRMVSENPYDLVLMDVQMPVMDGLAATAEIRRIPALAHLPIVALTASARPGDPERCRAAGMDGHIAKPLDPQELWREVGRWLPPGPTGGGSGPGAASVDGPAEELPSGIPGLDVAAGLNRAQGKRAVYLGLLRSFAAGRGVDPAEIRRALEDGDREAAERMAHTAKGLLGNLGAGPLEQWAGSLERSIHQGRTRETLDSLVDGLEIRTAELARQLRLRLPVHPVAGPGIPAGEAVAKEGETVLVVDDNPDNLAVMAGLLEGLYRVKLAGSGEQGLRRAVEAPQPDLILLDVMMPGSDGYDVMRRLKLDPRTRDIPVIFLTGRNRPEDERRGLEMGAVDYLAKPVSPPILLSRVGNHLKLKGIRDFLKSQNLYLEREVARRTREVAAIQDVTILTMASMAETRDNETGAHIRRTQHYVRLLARELRSHPRFRAFLTEENLDLLFKSAPLHDIGKVGIPDSILLKPGRLTPEEFEIMKRHTTLGRAAIEAAERQLGTPVAFLAIAKEIAEGHQEKWDGSGYPAGLKGDAIPISARLMAVADVYDALISRRVYKPALSHETAMKLMLNGRGSHFDPDILDAFVATAESFREVALRFQDPSPDLAERELRKHRI